MAIAVNPTHTPKCFAEIAIEPPTLGARDLLVCAGAISQSSRLQRSFINNMKEGLVAVQSSLGPSRNLP